MGGENVERLAQQHAYFLKALARLQEALAEPESSFVRDSIVKRFEMAFGLAWEILLALASREGVLGEVDAANAPHPSRGPQRDAALFRLSSCAQAQLEPQPSAPKGRGRSAAPVLLPLPLGEGGGEGSRPDLQQVLVSAKTNGNPRRYGVQCYENKEAAPFQAWLLKDTPLWDRMRRCQGSSYRPFDESETRNTVLLVRNEGLPALQRWAGQLARLAA